MPWGRQRPPGCSPLAIRGGSQQVGRSPRAAWASLVPRSGEAPERARAWPASAELLRSDGCSAPRHGPKSWWHGMGAHTEPQSCPQGRWPLCQAP